MTGTPGSPAATDPGSPAPGEVRDGAPEEVRDEATDQAPGNGARDAAAREEVRGTDRATDRGTDQGKDPDRDRGTDRGRDGVAEDRSGDADDRAEGAPEETPADPLDATPDDVEHPPEAAGQPAAGLPYQQDSVNPSDDSPATRGRPAAGESARGSHGHGRPAGVSHGPPAGSVLVAAAATGGWAAVVSFAPVLAIVLLGWFGTSSVSGGTAVRFAATAWLLGHGVPFQAPHGQVGLVPLGVTALIVWRLVRAGAHTARAVAATPRDVPYVVGAVAAAYGVIGCIAGIAADTARCAVAPWQALAITAVVGALASLPGALVETGAATQLWQRWPEPVREGLRGGGVAALWILAAGAGLAGLATAIAYQDAVDLYRGYGVGVGGGAGITLVGLLYAPNLAIWGASYLVGPGFGFGVDTGVTVFDVSLGALPAVPVLAGLPTGPAPTAVGVLLAVPVLAGIVVGVGTVRRHPDLDWAGLLAATGLTGAVAGVVLAAASFASSGPLGSGRLAEIGPRWWLVGLVAALVVAAGAVAAAASARALAERRPD